MALVAYLDWEVRTTGHDLNCSGFNRNRDATNGVDYTQQDNAEIISMTWRVEASINTWIRSTELTNWVNSGKTLASLKGNHIHLAGMAIAGGVLFDWTASTGKPGAYYLQAKGGGNPSWTTKPARVWLNKVYTPENASLPSGSNTWAWGDWDSLGYNTIYVRFGAESDADPDSKDQDDVIADGKTWTRGVYEIINVGTDGNGPYLVLDRGPAAVNSQGGYGRIGGAMASPGGVRSACGVGQRTFTFMKSGSYTLTATCTDVPGDLGRMENITHYIVGYDTIKRSKPSNPPELNITSVSGAHQPTLCFCNVIFPETGTFSWSSGYGQCIYCEIVSSGANVIWGQRSYVCRFYGIALAAGDFAFCYFKNCRALNSTSYQSVYTTYFGCIFDAQSTIDADRGLVVESSIIYGTTTSPLFRMMQGQTAAHIHNCVAVNCTYIDVKSGNGIVMCRNCYCYSVTNNVLGWTQLPDNPFRDPANGDFRLADNEAGRMLKQAGFQIPGPQGAPPMKFDVGAVQNSFYDLASGGIPGLPPMIFGG